ncbi:cyclic lactone autoinducer peptide [Irregularibacter muris]
MKKLILKCSGILASFALMVTTLNMNMACIFLVHQPKLPQEAKKLRKF